MILATKQKIQIARALRALLMSARRLAGFDAWATAKRGGITWHLDLNEGIDLAIYLGVYQKLAPRIRREFLRPGITVLDIGANIGAFTLPLAKAVGAEGAVVAVEATDYAFSKLQENLALNPALSQRVKTVQAFLTADGRDLPSEGVYSSWSLDGSQQSPRHPSHGGVLKSTNHAVASSLDALALSDTSLGGILRKTALIKLDVDGHELEVLRGARQFLKMTQALIVMEMAPYIQEEKHGGLQLLVDELTSNGYVLEYEENGKPIPSNAEEIMKIIPQGAGIDILCRPAVSLT